ncbi:MAG: TolC family protein [Halarcobacter ebronensis]|uniref:TolC family protein n=1 Tax=Halarcobacter ebronensis TaxID=1462615 RepID=UPI003C755A46
MNKKILKLLPLTFLGVNLYALDINEAIDKALTNNNSYIKQQYVYDEAKANVTKSQAGFLPKLDTSYTYNANKYDIGEGKDNANASAVLSYNLFSGLSDYYNLDAAKSNKAASKYSLEAARYDLVYETKVKYISYLKSLKNIETLDNAYKLLQKQYKDSENRFEQGLLARNDLLQVNAQMLQAKQNLARAKADSKVAWYSLKNILGGSLAKSEKIEDLNKNEVFAFDYKEEEIFSRSEIKALKKTVEALLSQKNANAYGTALPSVSLNLAHTKYGQDASLNSDELAFDDQSTATVNVKWNLYNGGADKAQTIILRKKSLQIKEDLEELKLNIKLQYENAVEEFEVSRLNYETAKISLEQSKENYKIVNNRFNEGLSTSTDLINANFLLTQAKQSFDNAFYDRFLAKASLDRIAER